MSAGTPPNRLIVLYRETVRDLEGLDPLEWLEDVWSDMSGEYLEVWDTPPTRAEYEHAKRVLAELS